MDGSDYDLPFCEPCPVVFSDTIVLPSASLAIRAKSPASVCALEEARKTNNIIFLARSPEGHAKDSTLQFGGGMRVTVISPEGHAEGSTPAQIFSVGTLCRVTRRRILGDDDSDVFVAEGLERATAIRCMASKAFLSADVFYDPTPDLVRDTEQLEAFAQEVRRLVKELHPLVSKEIDEQADTHNPNAKSAHRLFDVEGIRSPSRLADHTAVLLSWFDLIPTGQIRVILETFSPELRLLILVGILAERVETKQLESLLRRRMTRRSRRDIRLAEMFDESDRHFIHVLRAEWPERTAVTPRHYVSQHLLPAVDEAISSLFTEGRAKIEQEDRTADGVPPDRSALKKAADKSAARRRKAAKARLNLKTGPEKGDQHYDRKEFWEDVKRTVKNWPERAAPLIGLFAVALPSLKGSDNPVEAFRKRANECRKKGLCPKYGRWPDLFNRLKQEAGNN